MARITIGPHEEMSVDDVTEETRGYTPLDRRTKITEQH
jgi:hypothetical protein